jgi:hypothetical protein
MIMITERIEVSECEKKADLHWSIGLDWEQMMIAPRQMR